MGGADTDEPGPAFNLVAIAASAGGMSALRTVLGALPVDFPAPLLVVQHLDPRHRSLLGEVLNRSCRLDVAEAVDGEAVVAGRVYIAPPNRHLLVSSEATITLSDSELVHFVRPSADLLLESAAGSRRERVIAVVLTGTGQDGSMGVSAVKKMGGTVIAQDEASSEFFGMPGAAIHTGDVDFVLPLAEIASALITLTMGGGAL